MSTAFAGLGNDYEDRSRQDGRRQKRMMEETRPTYGPVGKSKIVFEAGERGHDPIFDDAGNPTGRVRMVPSGRIVDAKTGETIKGLGGSFAGLGNGDWDIDHGYEYNPHAPDGRGRLTSTQARKVVGPCIIVVRNSNSSNKTSWTVDCGMKRRKDGNAYAFADAQRIAEDAAADLLKAATK